VVSGFHRTKYLLADRPELAATLPHTRHSFPQLFVRDVQILLRLFDVRVAEHQLDRADVIDDEIVGRRADMMR